jgi:hypothetical protein
MTEQSDRHRDQLARNIVAMLFWRWRATLHTLTLYEQQAHKETDVPLLAYGYETQAYNDFMAARNAYYDDWNQGVTNDRTNTITANYRARISQP